MSGYRISFILGPDGELLKKNVNTLLAVMTLIDANYLVNHPEVPLLYQSGVKYQDECAGNDDWQDVPTTLRLTTGDCEDFACFRAAELQVRFGINAWPTTTMRRTPQGKLAFHSAVRLPDGTIEDPARKLGLVGDDEHSCTGIGEGTRENKITFCIDLFKGDQEFELSHKVLMLLLHALCIIDMRYLLANPNTPPLYQCGVRYQTEPEGREDWQDIPTNIHRREADCEDLACHRAAELRVKGIKAWPRFTWKRRQDGSFLYHIIVQIRDPRTNTFTYEDPSKILGMR
jgi:hypothetical protein